MYTVEQLIKFADTKPVITVNISELTWMYTHDRINKKRVAGVVIDGFPIIVTRRADGTLVTLDGFHRTYKAWKEGRKTIKARMITPADIEKLNKDAVVSTEDKDTGSDIKRIREFGESKDMSEDTIDGMIESKLEEKSSLENWLANTVAGSDDTSSLNHVLSNEGFMESAGDLLRNMVKGKKPSYHDMLSSGTDDTINRTYANPSWVAQRRMVKGEPTILNIGSMLVGDWKGEMKKVTQAAQACWQSNTPILTGLVNKAKPIIAFLDSDAWKDPAKIKDFHDNKWHELPLQVSFKNWTYKPADPQTAKVPTLDAEGVVEAAKTVLLLRDILKQTPFKKVGWFEMFHRAAVGGVNNAKWEGSDPIYNDMEEKYGDTAPFWHIQEITENLVGLREHVEYEWHTECENGLYEIYNYIRALVQLIDASVK